MSEVEVATGTFQCTQHWGGIRLRDQGRGALLDGDAHDTPASGFDKVTADDGVVRPVRPLHEHIRLQFPDDGVRCLLVEDGHGVHALQGGEDLGTFVLGRDGAFGSLVPADRAVRIDRDDEQVAERARLLQVADVARMEQVEDPVGEDDALAAGAGACREVRGGGSLEDRHGSV